MSKKDFYQGHLDRVSRSFAFCIAQLDEPERTYVASSYLLCRMLDTIEDTPWLDKDSQDLSYSRFEQFLLNGPDEYQVKNWLKSFPKSEIKDSEWRLLLDAEQIFADYHEFPSEIKANMQEQILTMSKGMVYFTKKKVNGRLKLGSLKEVNQYCFYVAGVVGELLTQIMSTKGGHWRNKSYLDAHHFGLFMQKVNLLKDHITDFNEGREFVHNRNQIYQSLRFNAIGAFKYLESIPLDLKNYRLFCAWSLYIGLSSLPVIQEGFRKNVVRKISRVKVMMLMQQIRSKISEPYEMRKMFLQLIEKSQLQIPEGKASKSQETSNDSMPYYEGQLQKNDLIQLGLI